MHSFITITIQPYRAIAEKSTLGIWTHIAEPNLFAQAQDVQLRLLPQFFDRIVLISPVFENLSGLRMAKTSISTIIKKE